MNKIIQESRWFLQGRITRLVLSICFLLHGIKLLDKKFLFSILQNPTLVHYKMCYKPEGVHEMNLCCELFLVLFKIKHKSKISLLIFFNKSQKNMPLIEQETKYSE